MMASKSVPASWASNSAWMSSGSSSRKLGTATFTLGFFIAVLSPDTPEGLTLCFFFFLAGFFWSTCVFISASVETVGDAGFATPKPRAANGPLARASGADFAAGCWPSAAAGGSACAAGSTGVA